jgi:hypothetical protein
MDEVGRDGWMIERVKQELSYRATADVTDTAPLDHVVEGFHNLLHWHVPVQAMRLQHINTSAQTLHTPLHSIEDMFPRQYHPIDLRTIIDSKFGSGRF